MKMNNVIKRKLIQIAAFGFTNSHLGNFAGGKLYTGKWKQFCNPGLNCYSCPAATLACPIGAMQAVAGSMQYNFSFYVVGFLLAAGVLLADLSAAGFVRLVWYRNYFIKSHPANTGCQSCLPM